MPCSRTPKWMLGPPKSPALIKGWPSMVVLLLPARSALPPIRLGSTFARALRILPLVLRVASPLGDGAKTGSAASQPSGSSPARMRRARRLRRGRPWRRRPAARCRPPRAQRRGSWPGQSRRARRRGRRTRLQRPAQVFLGGLELVVAQRLAVDLGGAGTVGAAVADHALAADDAGARVGLGGFDGGGNGGAVKPSMPRCTCQP